MIDKEKIDCILERAAQDGRMRLLEHEGYELIDAIGAGRPPKLLVLNPDDEIQPEDLEQFESDRVVLKIESPIIAHKTEAGGVEFLPKDIDVLRTRMRKMVEHVPDRYAHWLSEGHGRLPK